MNLDNITKFENNNTYNSMVSFIKESFNDNTIVTIDTYDMITMVSSGKGTKCYSSEVCSISLPDGSHINFKSFENKVDISRIISNTKGNGTSLMRIVFAAYISSFQELGEAGTLILECIGSVGTGSNRREMPVAQQAAFFRKFGFRKYGKYNANHIHMALSSNDDFDRTLSFLSK
jgi:hypothetical protein